MLKCFLPFLDDPEERINLINELPEIAEELEFLLYEYEQTRVTKFKPLGDPEAADPANFGGFWSPRWC